MAKNDLFKTETAVEPFVPGKLQLSDEMKSQYLAQVRKSMENVTARLPQIKISRETGLYIFPDDKTVANFVGIIIDSNLTKAYWHDAYSGQKNQPDCASLDAMVPTQWNGEKPIHPKCTTCPMNKWGSGMDKDGKKTKGKACRDMRRIHILIEGSLIPYRLSLPPTSLVNYDIYITELAGKNLPALAVITKFTTEKGDAGGFKVSKFKGEISGFIAQSQEEFETKFSDLVKQQKEFEVAMRGQAIEIEEYSIEETPGLDPTKEVSQASALSDDDQPF
jgi:hypothetical protein